MSTITVLPLLKTHPLVDIYAEATLAAPQDWTSSYIVIPGPVDTLVEDAKVLQYLMDTYGADRVVASSSGWHHSKEPAYLILKGPVLPVFATISGELSICRFDEDLDEKNPDWPNQVLSYTEQNPGVAYYIDSSMIDGLKAARGCRSTGSSTMRGGMVLDRSWLIRHINRSSFSLTYDPAAILRQERAAAKRAAAPKKPRVKKRAPVPMDVRFLREQLLSALFTHKVLRGIGIEVEYNKYMPLERYIEDCRVAFNRLLTLKVPFWKHKRLMEQTSFVHARVADYKYPETPKRHIVVFHNLIERIMKEAVRRGYKPDKEG